MPLICLPFYSSKQLQQNVHDGSHELIFQKNLQQEACKQHIRFHFQILYIGKIYRCGREQSEKVHYELIKGQALIYESTYPIGISYEKKGELLGK
ncbi:MAG: hypothetical protein KAX28_05145 [Candidatus Marinimicrobia bacterium]|nr:hypothetical protein [Candidatus Neomarinimicrobiota bacterium]